MTQFHEPDPEQGSGDFLKRGRRHRPMRWSIAGLILGIIALGLATIPTHVLAPDEDDPRPKSKGGVSFSIGFVSVELGDKDEQKEHESFLLAHAANTKRTFRNFTIAAIVCALIAMVVASIAHIRERHRFVTMGAVGCAAAAITWQYIAIGIAAGVAIAVLLTLWGAISSS